MFSIYIHYTFYIFNLKKEYHSKYFQNTIYSVVNNNYINDKQLFCL